MYIRKSAFNLLVLCLILPAATFAQKNELAITAGGQFPNNSEFNSGASWAVGASFAHRIFHAPLASLYWEIPVVGAPESIMKTPFRTTYSSLFVTPGLKVKFAPEFPLSPWLAAGVGVARYHNAANATFAEETSTKAVFDVGGGIDWKIAPFISARAEVRDFYSGLPDLGSATNLSGRQHNVVPQVGLVLRF
ncbi:MAG: outer membrane protein [Acidobacteriaceae bacterium]